MAAGLEEKVMDPRASVYSRIYAWWVLIQRWCTLRFSDHRGISPQEVKIDSSGFAAVLRRSKTIGADKPIVSRPLVLDKACWVSKSDWLMTGWRILQEAAGFERDYLLPVPTASFRGCKRIELKYEQGYAIQSKVLQELEVSGEKLFSHQITNFWTPHSCRAYVPSATQVLNFSKEDRDFLGGWMAQASDRHARTARRKIVNMQRTVVRHIETRSEDRFGEEETSAILGRVLDRQRNARSRAACLLEETGKLEQLGQERDV